MARLDQLLKLYAADPGDADVPYMIALEHGKAENYTEALGWLDKTLALDPSYHYAYYQKAQMLAASNRAEDARATAQLGVDKAIADGNQKAAGELNDLLQSL